MTEFADPYPAWIIGELIGIPAGRLRPVRRPGQRPRPRLRASGEPAPPRIEAALAGLYHCCDELIARRREHPGDGLVSALIAVEEQGDRLTEDGSGS